MRLAARASLVGLAALSLGGMAGAALTADVVDVVQKRRAFDVPEVTIARGGSVRFVNADGFPHQIHVEGPGLDSDSPLQGPGEALVVAFPAEGTFEVTCGIHPRMSMTVNVKQR